ncbi:pyruvate, phosphate dikinase [bacterium]|nr:pyruvate, phosphate dikinase [candidate division CSSED10-310 bacterium]
MEKRIYAFNRELTEGNKSMKALLGGKGANLAEMTKLGIPVPPGFTITTEVCREYEEAGNTLPDDLNYELNEHIQQLESAMSAKLGDPHNPLLVSVRSGAARSMPGMMDTVLNLGINPRIVNALAEMSGNRRFALDVYRRFMQMFGDVVMGVPHEKFEHALERIKEDRGVKLDTELDESALNQLIEKYKEIYRLETGGDFPIDPMLQLKYAIEAVFRSWNNPRARKYRELHDIKGLVGTAVNVQAMVFGNLGLDSGTGVAFTRNPANGANELYGEYLMNAQGEDVVAGIRTPKHIRELKSELPDVYDELVAIRNTLETHYHDMQDFEFTIQKQILYILQTRDGKRTTEAGVKIAVDMVHEGLISKQDAILRIDPLSLDQLLHPVFESVEEEKADILTKGLPASPGAATGKIMFTADDAENFVKNQIESGKKPSEREPVILVRIETSPEDIGGMAVSNGILTARGGMTSHAAVVARGMGICCVAGAGDISIDFNQKTMKIGDNNFNEGDWISLNGSTGCVYKGKIKTKPPEVKGPFETLMQWADENRKLKVRANADTPKDAAAAVKFGAEGIGLCRTEHMFFEGERIQAFRRLILVSETVKKLREEISHTLNPELIAALQKKLENPLAIYTQALAELLPLQREDFKGIFKALDGRPATIRTLDPPLHEFLPGDQAGQQEIAKTMGMNPNEVYKIVETLKEFNPMLGHRGCRLGISYPEVTAMQVRAIIEAAYEVYSEGISVHPEIMIPLVGHKKELEYQKTLAENTISEFCAENECDRLPFPVLIGTMIEVPRAAITADEIAEHAEFFSFGTNDLTQMGCGFSRDDAGSFLPEYVKLGIYEYDPFQVLDQNGVGLLIRIAVEKGRKMKPSLKIGICGEHGGEPKSIDFCHRVGLNYVSCSPFRVPIARLAAAQAALKEKQI